MKRVFIVHGWGGNSEESWFPWISEQLKDKEFQVTSLSMPNSETPVISEWVNHLNNSIDTPDNDTYLIGHSIGCLTIIKYLEQLSSNAKIGGVLFVAGWFTLIGLETEEEEEIAKPWLETSIDYDKVKRHIGSSYAIFSDDDPFVPLENEEFFKERLGSKTLVEHNKGHLNGETEVYELPSALNAILEISK